jgi:glutamate formiminotransferase
VPNFSEGRDRGVIDAIAGAIDAVPGTLLLDIHADPDHNRSVITFTGPPDAVAEAAVHAVGEATRRIDLRKHSGVHPRIGACDVLPVVPLGDVTMDDCARLARSIGERIWEQHRVPVYFYEAAATRPERRNLADVRRGQFEPDLGGPQLHPSAGAVVVGARKFLVAYNVDLETGDVQTARAIARKIRASSGGLPAVKAMGLLLASTGRAQVSINLADFEITPPHIVFEAVEREAALLGVTIASSELVGLIPARALEMAAGRDLKIRGFHPGMILENRIAQVAADTMN